MRSSSYAKWILSGEHSVVRGGKAIAFPLRKYECSIDFEKNDITSIKHNVLKPHYDLEEIFINLISDAVKLSDVDPEKLRGSFMISNNIPTNAGLGSSAAICSNIAKLLTQVGYSGDAFLLAKNLEDTFHKKSSGLDTAVAMTSSAIIFRGGEIVKHPKISFWSDMILTYSGEKLPTSDCSEIIRNLFSENRRFAQSLDETMGESVNLCEHGLEYGSFSALKDGINLGCEVFEKWGLINERLERHIAMLKSNGAVAAKPIGSGLGGYVVSLWESKPKLANDICLTLERP